MKKLYEKNKLTFAIVWIVAYCVLQSLANPLNKAIGGAYAASAAFCVLQTVVLFSFIRKNNLLKRYGLCKSSVPARRFLYYSLLLSTFNRCVVANGYITQLGLFHDNVFNQFNLACDLMEPFRPIVDMKVKKMGFSFFEKEQKYEMISLLKEEVIIGNRNEYLTNAIKIYTKSVFDALNDNEVSQIKFYRTNEL